LRCAEIRVPRHADVPGDHLDDGPRRLGHVFHVLLEFIVLVNDRIGAVRRADHDGAHRDGDHYLHKTHAFLVTVH